MIDQDIAQFIRYDEQKKQELKEFFTAIQLAAKQSGLEALRQLEASYERLKNEDCLKEYELVLFFQKRGVDNHLQQRIFDLATRKLDALEKIRCLSLSQSTLPQTQPVSLSIKPPKIETINQDTQDLSTRSAVSISSNFSLSDDEDDHLKNSHPQNPQSVLSQPEPVGLSCGSVRRIIDDINKEEGYRCDYSLWLYRLRLLFANKSLIAPQDLVNFQLFLLETGQFNASYALKELERLNFPISPFAITFDHAYLRATDTWAMQMLRSIYCSNCATPKNIYPIWLNSKQLKNELGRYVHLIKFNELSEFIKKYSEKKEIVWVEIDYPTSDEGFKKNINQNLDETRSKFKNKHFIFFYYDTFEGIDAIVVFNQKKLKVSGESPFIPVNRLVNSLGCRIDPTRATKTLLKFYPNLFIEGQETRKFWEDFKKTDVYKRNQKKLEDSFLVPEPSQSTVNSEKCILKFNLPILIPQRRPENFQLYFNFLSKCIKAIKKNTSQSFQSICYPEIEHHFKQFQTSCEIGCFKDAFYAAQSIVEILQLHLNLSLSQQTFSEVIKQRYDFNEVLITPYAMRAFTLVLEMIPGELCRNIVVTTQSYYELLENLEKVDTQGVSVSLIRHIDDVKAESDVIFVEIHSNNLMIKKQFAQDLIHLLKMIEEWQRTKQVYRTIVVDITLNSFDDVEIQSFLTAAQTLIESGFLNVVLIQSLTKFAQLGLDKKSGGCLAIRNKKSDWTQLWNNFERLKESEKTDSSTDRFFAFFAEDQELLNRYIEMINQNVRYVYHKVLEGMNQLELSSCKRFQINMSSDSQACYIAINMKNLVGEVESSNQQIFPSFSISSEEIQRFSDDLINEFFYPLCKFFDLPITARASIGFPLTSINGVYDSFRITIGLESSEQLDKYAEILIYIAFVINRQRDTAVFFYIEPTEQEKSIKDRSYRLRTKLFQEKIKIFQAMTLNSGESSELIFNRIGLYNSYRNPATGETRQLQTKVHFHSGRIDYSTELPQCDGPKFVRYGIDVHLRNKEIVDFEEIDPNERRIIAACFTEIATPGKEPDQSSNLEHCSRTKKVNICSYENLGNWSFKNLYGPFKLEGSLQQCYLFLAQFEIFLFEGSTKYSEKDIIVKQGSILTPLSDMPISDREFLIRQGAYPQYGLRPYHRDNWSGCDLQYTPTDKSSMKVTKNAENKFIIEHDQESYQTEGISIYHRRLSDQTTCFEIDYWGEKDPVLSRFLRVMMAISIKEKAKKDGKVNVNFKSGDASFSHFVFNLDEDTIVNLFKQVIDLVVSKKEDLIKLLKKKIVDSGERYSFNEISDRCASHYIEPNWPCPPSGASIDYIANKGLILECINILGF